MKYFRNLKQLGDDYQKLIGENLNLTTLNDFQTNNQDLLSCQDGVKGPKIATWGIILS